MLPGDVGHVLAEPDHLGPQTPFGAFGTADGGANLTAEWMRAEVQRACL